MDRGKIILLCTVLAVVAISGCTSTGQVANQPEQQALRTENGQNLTTLQKTQCIQNWQCDEWSTCLAGLGNISLRTCNDGCGNSRT